MIESVKPADKLFDSFRYQVCVEKKRPEHCPAFFMLLM
ncbi:MAG TPA: hypothetical protein DHV15_07135 [Treponema sp.]|uniref:Uncharacterized protein n=1 Tax=Treponema denticola (strain ATCC 35405 / DSM 14222 / CIP 103919 / JCM 8153 / KCTC 15104) TaxID=243275 RepID=Q73KB3_TREDE|nr:hypothetical protein TDE_2306 [Treponema denticola ATCC 35405]HCY95274.1 hypothetical protein [Treponema sp.]